MTFVSRLIKFIIIVIAILAIALAALLTFGPISNPKAMLGVLFGYTIESPTAATLQQRLQVPKGFSIGRYASDLGNIRFMAFTNTGDLLVSQPRQGRVILLQADANNDDTHDGERVLIDQLRRPHGLAFHHDWLYIAESNAVGRVRFDHATGQLNGAYERIITGLTDDGNHWSKSLLIRDDKLLVSMGSTCNVCEEQDARRASIMQFELDGSDPSIYASGLRNSVGFDTAPWNDNIYATDNGRDLLGDGYPPCELNLIEADQFYGWPYINGFGDLDPDFGNGKEPLLTTARSPVFGFAPHNAPLGIRFLRTSARPDSYQKTALVALHGSWNRSSPDGYKVVALDWDENGVISSRDFLTGFELDGDVIGRPVDIAEGPDGCIFVSDDYSGSIYRICYGQSQITSTATTALDSAPQQSLSAETVASATLAAEHLIETHQCLECHHLNGVGNTQSGKTLNNLSQRYKIDTLSDYFVTPNAPMPQYPFSAEQRRNLAIYLLNSQQN